MTRTTQCRPRANPMPADERREQLVLAALPLVRKHGRAVSTKAVAEAAGVSEGTLFYVFGDKQALIEAVVEQELHTTRARQRLAEVDPSLPLPERIAAIVEILRERLTEVFELMAALGLHRPPGEREQRPRHEPFLEIVASLLRPDAAALRYSPERTAELIRLVTFSASHPAITDGSPLPATDIADLLLQGIVNHHDTAGGRLC